MKRFKSILFSAGVALTRTLALPLALSSSTLAVTGAEAAASDAKGRKEGQAIVTSVKGTATLSTAIEAPKPAPALELKVDEWTPLFDGKTLKGWKPTDFAGAAEIEVKDGQILAPMGAMLTGVTYTNPTPTVDYELSLEAMKVDGSDFFCGLTFPVKDSHATLILGGWGGGVVGISSIDGYDASMNETTEYMAFDRGRWYRIRVRVTDTKIQAWIDDDRLVNVDTTDKKISLRFGEIELSKPLGLAAWITSAAWRNIRIRAVEAE